jgi:transposase-like protein
MLVPPPGSVVIPIGSAPKKAPCPRCGKPARRKRTCRRYVRTIAYKQVAFLRITYGEYSSRCGCQKSFRTHPEEVLPKHAYDNKVRNAVLEHILDGRLNVEATLHILRRDFLLELSSGFVYDCLRDAVRRLDLADYRRQVLERFRGTLCVDEIHLGDYTLLLATDPLADLPVAFALVSKNDQAHMRRFLKNLKDWGLNPEVVVTDGSSLYPAVLAEVWPDAQHQLCVFHVLQDINADILDGVKRLRRHKARQGHAGRKPKGRRARGAKQRRRGPTAKDKAHFVFKRRHLIVKRRENLSAGEKKDLATMLEYIPGLRVLRRFADRIYALLSEEQSEEQAWRRWRRLQGEKAFRAVPELARVLEALPEEKFRKVIAFLRQPVGRRVRTNNHVERVNRRLRYWEKVRYKWRRQRTLVRFVLLVLSQVGRARFDYPPCDEQAAVPGVIPLTAPDRAAQPQKRARRQAA